MHYIHIRIARSTIYFQNKTSAVPLVFMRTYEHNCWNNMEERLGLWWVLNILGLLHANSVGNWRVGLRTALDLMLKWETRVLRALLTAFDFNRREIKPCMRNERRLIFFLGQHHYVMSVDFNFAVVENKQRLDFIFQEWVAAWFLPRRQTQNDCF